MKLYVFYFSRVTKEVVRDEVEVEDKPKSYKTPAGYCLPYLEVSKFLKADTDKIYHDAYVSENGDYKKAVLAFRKYFAIKHRNASMKNFSIKDGVIRHNRLPLIMDVFIKGAHNPHKGEATHG